MVALDHHADRKLRRPLRSEEEFLLRRGRDHEARIVEQLGWPEPEYPTTDFEKGAEVTFEMMQSGIEGISQAVLIDAEHLGIPDLLRRETGASNLGDHCYVVGDIKSSGRPRSDQVLQVAFYSRMLGRLQGRAPEYGYLILKDGSEERFELSELDPVLDELLQDLYELREEPDVVEPFFARACDTCLWSERCLRELEERDDLSFVQGVTRGIRQSLRRAGIDSAAALEKVGIEPAARKSGLEATLLRRLKKAAAARLRGEPVLEKRGKGESLESAALLHFLSDPYEERVLFMGILWPRDSGPEFLDHCPLTQDEELPAFEDLLKQLPSRLPILHYGSGIPRWHDGQAHASVASVGLERRLIDMARQLRGAAVYPSPIFGLAEHVSAGLSRDPHRQGRGAAAALAVADGQDSSWLVSKGRSDLEDMLALKERFLGGGGD
jgi:predicted RecB family nuclease